MGWLAVWDGYGSSYGREPWDGLEWFGSLERARDAMERRYFDTWRGQAFSFVRVPMGPDGFPAVGPVLLVREVWGTPGVSESAHMTLWSAESPNDARELLEARDPYPSRIIERGPRGGLRMEVC